MPYRGSGGMQSSNGTTPDCTDRSERDGPTDNASVTPDQQRLGQFCDTDTAQSTPVPDTPTGGVSSEDEMVNTILTQMRQAPGSMCHSEPEAHYDHFGNRGAADLYLTIDNRYGFGKKTGIVYEMKSECAVQEATGANEIIRQYNRMRQYFFQDENRPVPAFCSFRLCFIISENTVAHVCENFEMYMATNNSNLARPKSNRDTEHVLFRLPGGEHWGPVALMGNKVKSPSDWKSKTSTIAESNSDVEPFCRVSRILDDLGY